MKSITRLSLALMMFSLFSISYLVTSVSAQGMTPPRIPQADDSSRPIGEGGEAGGPAAKDMGGNMINDGGHGANSGADAEATMAACMATKSGSSEARADLCR